MAGDKLADTIVKTEFFGRIFHSVLGNFGIKIDGATDSKQLLNKLNELAVAQFRILQHADPKYTESAAILDMVFPLLIESDQLCLSLTIYEAVALPKKENEKAEVFKTENYAAILELIHETIMACRCPDVADWIKAVINRFDEAGFIGGNALVRFARKLKNTDLLAMVTPALAWINQVRKEFYADLDKRTDAILADAQKFDTASAAWCQGIRDKRTARGPKEKISFTRTIMNLINPFHKF